MFWTGCTKNDPKVKSIRSTFYAALYKDGSVVKRFRANPWRDEYRILTPLRKWDDELLPQVDYLELFDRDGDMIKKTEFRWNDRTQTEDTIKIDIYRYDRNRRLSCVCVMTEEFIDSEKQYLYRHKQYAYLNDMVFEQEYLDSTISKITQKKTVLNRLNWVDTFQYDNRKRLIRTNHSYYAVYEGDLLKEEKFDDRWTSKYQYDKSGQKKMIYEYHEPDTIPFCGFAYHYNQNSLEEVFSFGDKNFARQVLNYDENRLLKQRIIYQNTSDTVLWRIDYSYDQYKNLICTVPWRPYNIYSDPVYHIYLDPVDHESYVPAFIIEREIEYY
jgi:hypothetical protein